MYCAPLAEDIASLQSVGGQFCTSYLGYSPSAVVGTAIETPATSTVQATAVESVTVSSTTFAFQKRSGVPTPSFIANWPAEKISAACSQVATGVTSTTTTTTASTPYVTQIVATSTSTIVSLATQTCKASVITGGDIQNGLTAWSVSDHVSVLDDHSAAVFRAVGCGSPYCSDFGDPESVGGSLTQTVNFGKCVDQSYTFSFSYQVGGNYGNPYMCPVGLQISDCKDGVCLSLIQSDYGIQWRIGSTNDGWHTWSHTFLVIPEAEDRDFLLEFGLACAWYSYNDILVKDLTLGPSTA